MITPLIMLAILSIPLLLTKLWGKPGQTAAAAAVGLGLLFLFTASGHFTQTTAMIAMLPSWVPWRREIVLATGVLEALTALGLLVPATRRPAGWAALAMLVGFFPANVYAAVNHTGMGGHVSGPEYLLVRAPLQAVLIAWTYWLVLRPRSVLAPAAALAPEAPGALPSQSV